MNDKKTMKITTKNGDLLEYEILLAFRWLKTKKDYVVYTDNTMDENGSLNIYAAIYYPDDSTKLDSIETDEEWDEIQKRLENMEGFNHARK